jgi:hypothetical protein
MSDLVVVPSWVLDALADSGDPATQDASLRFKRWQAHTRFNPALFDGMVDKLDRMRGELAQIALLLRGEGPLVGGTVGLQSVDPGEFGRQAEAELTAERASRLRPSRD